MNTLALTPNFNLDSIFASLADPTRRDILRRLSTGELTIGAIAEPYSLTFAAISKHIKLLERARLVIKRRQGKQQYVALAPGAFASATAYLEWYRNLWEERLDSLDNYLNKEQADGRNNQN
jgi:DNA-binding transcriptional ArsR family regulator